MLGKLYNISYKNKMIFLTILYSLVIFIIYLTGGTKYAYPHLIYIPFFLSSLYFQVMGGISGAIISGVFLAIIPMDTVTLEMQSLYNQFVRFIIFLGFGYILGVISKIIHKEYEKVKSASLYDNIAELPNHNAFKLAIDSSMQNNENFSIAIIFIENKFEIHNSIGHSNSDVILKTITRLLSSYSIENEIKIFYSDNNYKFLLKEFSENETQKWIEKVTCELIKYPVIINNFSVFLKIKTGAVYHDTQCPNSDELIKKAFIAMDYSFTHDKDFHIYSDHMKQMFDFTTLVLEFQKGLIRNHLHLEYQPKLNLLNNKTYSAEALIRWNHPNLGLIPPLSFIPQLEKTTYINDLTYWILETVINDIKDWSKKGINLKISLNLTPKNIQDETFVNKMLLFIKNNEPYSRNIEFELTETDLMTKLETIKDNLNKFRVSGITFAIDDFGTGYSSLAYLKTLPIDCIKIDRTFIKDLLNNDYDKEIVSTTIKMAHALGKTIVAEGVEDVLTLELLDKMGCNDIQGYYHAKPMRKEALEIFIKN